MKLLCCALTICSVISASQVGAMADTMSYGLPNNPDLLYEQATGNVKIFADDASMISFNLQSAGQFNPPADFSDLTTDTLGIASINIDNGASAIGWTSALNGAGIGFDGPAGSVDTPFADLGNIFPTGLDINGLQSLLTNNQWAYTGGGGQFDLAVAPVPEPSSMALLALGTIGLFMIPNKFWARGRMRYLCIVAMVPCCLISLCSNLFADNGYGLRAEYRADTVSFESAPDIIRIDSGFNYPFGIQEGYTVTDGDGTYPFPENLTPSDTNGNGLADVAFSALWRGYFNTGATGTYQFRVNHNDEAWITVGGQQVMYVGCCGIHGSQTFPMYANQWVPIEIRYTNIWWSDAFLSIELSGDGGSSWDYLGEPNIRYSSEGLDFLYGDTDNDGDVDTSDLTTIFQNFTGHGNTGKWMTHGDFDWDGDVDTADLTSAFQNFTGALEAELLYDPLTGNVKLDASDSPGDVITQFSLENAIGGQDFDHGSLNFPFGGVLGYSPTDISLADPSETGFSGVFDLGDIFPTGLDETSLSTFLTAANYAGLPGTGTSRPLDLVIVNGGQSVPEPGSLSLSILGLAGLAMGGNWGKLRRGRG